MSFHRRHQAAGDASVVSVVFDDGADEVQQFFDDNDGDWPVVDGKGPGSSSTTASPGCESYLVAPTGLVAAKITGGVTSSGLDDVIVDLEAEA